MSKKAKKSVPQPVKSHTAKVWFGNSSATVIITLPANIPYNDLKGIMDTPLGAIFSETII